MSMSMSSRRACPAPQAAADGRLQQVLELGGGAAADAPRHVGRGGDEKGGGDEKKFFCKRRHGLKPKHGTPLVDLCTSQDNGTTPFDTLEECVSACMKPTVPSTNVALAKDVAIVVFVDRLEKRRPFVLRLGPSTKTVYESSERWQKRHASSWRHRRVHTSLFDTEEISPSDSLSPYLSRLCLRDDWRDDGRGDLHWFLREELPKHECKKWSRVVLHRPVVGIWPGDANEDDKEQLPSEARIFVDDDDGTLLTERGATPIEISTWPRMHGLLERVGALPEELREDIVACLPAHWQDMLSRAKSLSDARLPR